MHLNKELIFSRKQVGRFPEAKELKQLVRDHINPKRNLGHSDRRPGDRVHGDRRHSDRNRA